MRRKNGATLKSWPGINTTFDERLFALASAARRSASTFATFRNSSTSFAQAWISTMSARSTSTELSWSWTRPTLAPEHATLITRACGNARSDAARGRLGRQRTHAERGAVTGDHDHAAAAFRRLLGRLGAGDDAAGEPDPRRVDSHYRGGGSEQDREEDIERPHATTMRRRPWENIGATHVAL